MELQPHILEPQPHIGWGEIEIKANSAQLELKLGLSLAIMTFTGCIMRLIVSIMVKMDFLTEIG